MGSIPLSLLAIYTQPIGERAKETIPHDLHYSCKTLPINTTTTTTSTTYLWVYDYHKFDHD